MFQKDVTIPTGLTYSEWLERIQRLEKVKDLTGEKILYARSKNLMKLRRFAKVNSMDSRIPMTEEFKKFQRALAELRNKFVTPGPQGPMVDVNNPEFTYALQALQEEHKKAIDERDLDIQMYNDFLGEEVPNGESPDVHKVAVNDSLKDLTQEQVDAIWWFVEERKEEPKVTKMEKVED